MNLGKDMKLFIDGKRIDGRGQWDLRDIEIKANVLNQADGSAYIKWGQNKIIAGVMGPRECLPKHQLNPYKTVVHCRYMMSPFCSLEEHGRSGPSRRSTELSKVIRKIFENVIIVENYPKTAIDIYIDVLQANGGTRVAAVVAAAVALADAGIQLKDIPFAVSGGKVEGKLVMDLCKEEDNFGQSDVPLSGSNRTKEIFLMQMDGLLTKEELLTLIDKSFESGEKISQIQKDALKKVYEGDGKIKKIEMG